MAAFRTYQPDLTERSRRRIRRLGPHLVGTGLAGVVLLTGVLLLLTGITGAEEGQLDIGPFEFEDSGGWSSEGALAPGGPYALRFESDSSHPERRHTTARSRSFRVPQSAGLGFRYHMDSGAAASDLVLTILGQTTAGMQVLFESAAGSAACEQFSESKDTMCPVGVDLRAYAGQQLQLVLHVEANGTESEMSMLLDDLVVIPGAGATF